MLLLNKIPWLSLMLVSVSYSALGWILYTSKLPWYIVLLSAISVVLTAEVLAAPVSLLRTLILTALKSDVVAFIFVFSLAFVVTVMMSWMDVIVRILLLIAAGLLAKLDLQTNGFRPWQAFWILSGFSLAGFGFGWIVHYFYPLYR